MATNYPGSLDTSSQQPSPSASTEMDDSGFEHDAVHTNHSGAIIALETKVGTGDSNAVANSVLAGTGSGTSGWATAPTLSGLTVDTDTLHVDATNDRVGIGTTSPATDLDIKSGAPVLRFTGTDTGLADDELAASVEFYTSDTDNAGVGAYIHADGDGTSGGVQLRFGTGTGGSAADRVTVTSSGSVGIGDASPNSQIEVVSTDQRAFRFERDQDVSSNAVTCGIMQIGTDSTDPGTNDYWILFRKGNNTTIGSVRGTGSASVNFSTTSDSTLKTDRGIAAASRIGSIIDGLQVHEFDWKEGDVTGQIGLFAQEAIDVLPESIVNAPAVEPATADSEEQYVAAALDYSKIVPILIAECQFLRQRVAALEAA